MRLNILRHQFRRSTLVIFALAAFVVGIIFARFNVTVSGHVVFLSFCMVPFALHRRIPALITVIIVSCALGVWRGQATMHEIFKYNSILDEQIVVFARIVDDPVYVDKGQTEFYISSLTLQEPYKTTLPGKIRVRTFRSGFLRSDIVRVKGKLYDGYASWQGSMSFADVTTLSRNNSALERLRRAYFAAAHSVLPDSEASLGLGFLVGARSALPDLLNENLSRTGLTHIVAVSGFNLTVLVRITRRLFGKKSAFVACFSSVILIGSFVIITGVSPSIARASIVSCFALLGWYYGRPLHPLMLLFLGAAITAGINPLYAWGDLGWYLSFLAFFGVLVLGPVVHQRFIKREMGFMGQILLETTAAQVMTLPLIMATFGTFSFVSLLANAIILPFVSIAMACMFFAGACTLLVPMYGGWFALPARYVLEFIVDAVAVLGQPSWALIGFELSWAQAIGMYIFLILLVIIAAHRIHRNRKNDDQKDPVWFELV